MQATPAPYIEPEDDVAMEDVEQEEAMEYFPSTQEAFSLLLDQIDASLPPRLLRLNPFSMTKCSSLFLNTLPRLPSTCERIYNAWMPMCPMLHIWRKIALLVIPLNLQYLQMLAGENLLSNRRSACRFGDILLGFDIVVM